MFEDDEEVHLDELFFEPATMAPNDPQAAAAAAAAPQPQLTIKTSVDLPVYSGRPVN